MKLYEIIAVVERLKEFKFINRARRVDNNTIELNFDKDNSYFFNMTRGHSFIYKKESKRPLESYQAPFDNIIYSQVSSAKILAVEVLNGDRVIRFKLAPKSQYKSMIIYLQFEFTGKNTNAILIDSEGFVIEALRHIDSDSSFRVVRPNIKLQDIPIYEGRVEDKTIEDIDEFLENSYKTYHTSKLNGLKKQKVLEVTKKIDKLSKELNSLASEDELALEYKKNQDYANLILANLYQIKPYDRSLKTYGFDGNEITIKLPKNIVKNRLSDYFFNLSKRAKNRAKKIYIEKDNLTSKKEFYKNIRYSIENSNDIREIEILAPKRAKSKKKKAKLKECELFWIEDYKVLVGRNSRENQKLLELAKANDIWMHIRNIPSSHVIIKTDKQNLPQHIIELSAKLCVDFSVKAYGDYEVDYTKRKFVKVQDGSNVLYNKYDTISVTKEGVEIRE